MSLWDPKMATTAQAINQALTMGGVILKPKGKPSTGFTPPSSPEPPKAG